MLEFRLVLLRCAYSPTVTVAAPHHLGVAIRGALGASLFERTCFEKERCHVQHENTSEIRCAFPASCLYKHIFASDDPQYLISPITPDTESFSAGLPTSFYLILLGRATDHLALVVKTLHSAKPFKVHSNLVIESLASYQDTQPTLVFSEDTKLQAESIKLIRAATLLESKSEATQVTLEFLTPTYLTKADDGKQTRVVKEPDFLLIMQALNRRLKCWAETEGVTYSLPSELLELAKTVKTSQSHLSTVRDSRFSKRQKQTVWLGGITGTMTFENVPTPLLGYLQLAEYLHLGKKTVYGNGKIRLYLG